MPPAPPEGDPPSGFQNPTQSWTLSSNRWRRILLVTALFAVVTLAAGLLWITTDDRKDPGSTSSAGDVDRTVGLLREKDPVCDEWGKHADELAENTRTWLAIDPATPAANWSLEQLERINTAAEAILSATDRFESILPLARNPVLQELVAQVIVYWRAYVDSIPEYTERDGKLSGVASNFGNAVTFICAAMPLSPQAEGNSRRQSSTEDIAELTPVIVTFDAACDEFMRLANRQNALLRSWADEDPAKPASEWSSEQRRLNRAAQEVLTRDAGQVRNIAEGTANTRFANLLFTYSAYVQAFVESIPRYTQADDQLWKVATYLAGGLGSACEAEL